MVSLCFNSEDCVCLGVMKNNVIKQITFLFSFLLSQYVFLYGGPFFFGKISETKNKIKTLI